MRFRCVLIPAIAVLRWASASPGELAVEKKRWVRVDTAHFTILSDAPERNARNIGEQLEKFRGVLGAVSSLNLDETVDTYIYLFKNDKPFAPYKSSDRSQAYMLATPEANFVGLDARPTADTKVRMRNAFIQYPYRVVYHEYVHYVLRNNVHSLSTLRCARQMASARSSHFARSSALPGSVWATLRAPVTLDPVVLGPDDGLIGTEHGAAEPRLALNRARSLEARAD